MHTATDQDGVLGPLLSTGATDHPDKKMTYGTSNTDADVDMDSHALEVVDYFPPASWTVARRDAKKRQFPQTIAHRGYKAVYPENTLKAFKGALEVGTHAIETDIHLSKDDVVVLSHDPDLKRCFGKNDKIIDCDWHSLKQLKTLAAPHEPMPRLQDLLELIAKPEHSHIWILLDIKLDTDADKVMRLIAKTLQSVNSGSRPWTQRVVLGIWAAKYLTLSQKYLPGYPVSYIGFSTVYARRFLQVPNISFNMLQKVLLGPVGARFIRDIKAAGRPLFVWTVNEPNLMRWSIQKEVDGVITDDPKKFLDICDKWSDREPTAYPTWFQWLYTFWLFFMIFIFSIPFRRKFPEPIEKHFIRSRDLRTQASLTFGA